MHLSTNDLLFASSDLGCGQDVASLHSFGTTFSTTANASGLWDGDLVEARLSHAQGTVQAYCNRTAYMARSREMMQCSQIVGT